MIKNLNTSSPTVLRLTGLISYDRSAKVRWLLTELGIDFEDRFLDRQKKEHETPDFLKLNPMGRVPVLEMGKQVMFESGAICAFLADQYMERGLAPALDSPDRALYQQWMYFAASTLDMFQIRVMIIEDIPAGKIQTEKLTALQSDLRDAMMTLQHTLSKNQYLVGNSFTAADLCVVYHLDWCKLWPELENIMQDFPQVMKYLERVKNRPASLKANVFSYKAE